ncbi:Uu.00g113310.m01.CDS01 [Anthostomella pinea]|uniref:Uu.00g113310.m01.CDS01 n=1 Tax=Anthostomella pinea TaxID=933095 RepID=A0AAI8VAA8_9PEZI|nr:Uu.00g113310.m01.CDS01 [Anthostomella pinea]
MNENVQVKIDGSDEANVQVKHSRPSFWAGSFAHYRNNPHWGVIAYGRPGGDVKHTFHRIYERGAEDAGASNGKAGSTISNPLQTICRLLSEHGGFVATVPLETERVEKLVINVVDDESAHGYTLDSWAVTEAVGNGTMDKELLAPATAVDVTCDIKKINKPTIDAARQVNRMQPIRSTANESPGTVVEEAQDTKHRAQRAYCQMFAVCMYAEDLRYGGGDDFLAALRDKTSFLNSIRLASYCCTLGYVEGCCCLLHQVNDDGDRVWWNDQAFWTHEFLPSLAEWENLQLAAVGPQQHLVVASLSDHDEYMSIVYVRALELANMYTSSMMRSDDVVAIRNHNASMRFEALLVMITSTCKYACARALSVSLKADFSVSAGLHSRHESTYNEFSVNPPLDHYRGKLAASKGSLNDVWETVNKNEVEPAILRTTLNIICSRTPLTWSIQCRRLLRVATFGREVGIFRASISGRPWSRGCEKRFHSRPHASQHANGKEDAATDADLTSLRQKLGATFRANLALKDLPQGLQGKQHPSNGSGSQVDAGPQGALGVTYAGLAIAQGVAGAGLAMAPSNGQAGTDMIRFRQLFERPINQYPKPQASSYPPPSTPHDNIDEDEDDKDDDDVAGVVKTEVYLLCLQSASTRFFIFASRNMQHRIHQRSRWTTCYRPPKGQVVLQEDDQQHNDAEPLASSSEDDLYQANGPTTAKPLTFATRSPTSKRRSPSFRPVVALLPVTASYQGSDRKAKLIVKFRETP